MQAPDDALALPPAESPLPQPPAPPADVAPPFVPRSGFVKALPGIVVCIFALALTVTMTLLIPVLGLKPLFDSMHSQSAEHEPLTLPNPESLAAKLAMTVPVLLGMLGLLVPPIVLCAALVSRPVRSWLERLLAWMARRPMPAIGFIDALAAYLVYFAAQITILCAVFSILHAPSSGVKVAATMVVNDAAMLVAVCVIIGLACLRARGWHGALGFFPPWSSRFVTPKRSILADMGLGLACYPLALAGVFISSVLNRFITPESDQHVIISMLKHHTSIPVVVAIMVSATAGAAFFEEILFRGVLYNALRRHLGGPSGALVAAFIFSLLHGLPSQLFALFVLGAILTWLYDKTGRLVAGMTLHFTVNLVSTVNLLLLLNQK